VTSLLKRLAERVDPDRVLQATMASFIEARAMRHGLAVDREEWRPGKPLKLLLAGYVGSRNTGADVRVEEMIRQFRHIVGDERLEQTIMTTDLAGSAGYFRTVRQVELPQLFPKFLYDECARHHGVVACEGSMFKSKFASALTCMMAGALGMANAENKLSIGYGAEAGHMTDSLQSFVRRHCRDSLVICRNEPSREVLGRLGIRTTGGADTAWTFEPAPARVGAEVLRRYGWDGAQPILVVCPINPFWWPVKPDLAKAFALRMEGQYRDEHYRSIYFHDWNDASQHKYDTYLDALAEGARAFASRYGAFVVLVGMEKLDRRSCEDLAARIPGGAPVIVSDEHDMYSLVSVLRNARYMLSSRFHAVVTSMPGLVASGGVTMDERIRNLMNDRGTPELFLEVDEPDLAAKVVRVLETLAEERERVVDAIARAVPKQLAAMGQMGIDFAAELRRVYPEFPLPRRPATWEAHLPSLAPELTALLERSA
jgi:polysaccharide pyruvyl transferase WcaK-like protein